jgi:hypothetical protein
MAKVLFTDNAQTTLASGISIGSTSVSLTAGTGALFPNPNTSLGQYFYGTFVSATNPNTREIVTCSARSTDTLTISAVTVAWNAGDTFALLQPAEAMQALAQFDDLQAQLGNYAIDVGAANAYQVGLTPALVTHVDGMPIRWRATHTNTGNSTFSDGVGAAALLLPGGYQLVAGTIQAGWTYTSIWSTANTCFELHTGAQSFAQLVGTATAAQVPALSGLNGQVTSGQVPQAAVTQYTSVILASAALTGDPTAPTAAAGTSTTQIATTAFVETAVNPASALANFGYQKFQSGLIIQWGTFTSSGSGGQSVNFGAVSFSSACYNVQLTSSVGGYNAGVVSVSTSGFVADTSQIGNQTVYYFATGR